MMQKSFRMSQTSTGILIGGGYRELKGKLLRIGHMGYQAQKLFIAATMDALEDILKTQIK